MPEISKEHGQEKQVDLRCGFQKNFLKHSNLEDQRTSQIRLKKGNVIELTGNFGCGVFVGVKESTAPLSLFSSFFGDEEELVRKEHSNW